MTKVTHLPGKAKVKGGGKAAKRKKPWGGKEEGGRGRAGESCVIADALGPPSPAYEVATTTLV